MESFPGKCRELEKSMHLTQLPVQMIRKTMQSYFIAADLIQIVECKVREGFSRVVA